MKRFLKNITLGFKNLKYWLPIIWKDRDWDDSYITEILIKKLEKQRDYFLSDKPIISNAKKYAGQMQKVIDGLNKTKDDFEYYYIPASQEFDKKWGEVILHWDPITEKGEDYKELIEDGEDPSQLFQLRIEREGIKTPEDKEQCSKEYREMMKSVRDRYMKDKVNLYRYLARHIDFWWD